MLLNIVESKEIEEHGRVRWEVFKISWACIDSRRMMRLRRDTLLDSNFQSTHSTYIWIEYIYIYITCTSMYQKDLESLYLIDSRIVQSVLNIQLERCNFPSTLKRVRVIPMGSAGNRTSNFIERREKERERESSLENTLPLSADAVKTWPTSLSRWLAGSECILELENKKELAGETVAESVTRARYSITIRCLHSYCKSLYQIFRKQHFFSALNKPRIHVRFFFFFFKLRFELLAVPIYKKSIRQEKFDRNR